MKLKPSPSSNEICDEEAVFKMFPSLLFLFQLTLIYPVLSVTLDLQFSVHDDGDRAATPGKQTMKEIQFSKFKLPTFSSQVMPNENLFMSSNRNVQGIGYSQLQNKLLETYPKMLKEPHNLQRKHRSKGPLIVP
ncbi:hypothetical protein Avbf_12254 [Armadillidium vulgare]|nr:hypothetical protein Avbf_12254 [Armadillidium vulgare]